MLSLQEIVKVQVSWSIRIEHAHLMFDSDGVAQVDFCEDMN